MPALALYLVPATRPTAEAVADGLEAVEPGPVRDVVLMARPDAVKELKRREAARLVRRYLAEGGSKQYARQRAAVAVGVSEWTVRVTWDL